MLLKTSAALAAVSRVVAQPVGQAAGGGEARRGQAEFLDPVEHRGLVGVVVVIVVMGAAAEGEHREMERRVGDEGDPGAVLQQVEEVLLGRGLGFDDRLDALLGREEGHDEEDEAENRPDGHGHLPAVLAVMALREFGDERQRQAADDELGDVGGNETVGVDLGALVEVGRHDAAQGGIRHVVHRVEGHQDRVGDAGVGDQPGRAPALRGGVGEDHDDGPGEGGPEHPRAEFAPAGVGPVGDHAHDGVEGGVPEPRPEQDRRGGAGREAEHIGVETRLKEHHRHEHEVRGGVARTVTGFFDEGQLLGGGIAHGVSKGFLLV